MKKVLFLILLVLIFSVPADKRAKNSYALDGKTQKEKKITGFGLNNAKSDDVIYQSLNNENMINLRKLEDENCDKEKTGNGGANL